MLKNDLITLFMNKASLLVHSKNLSIEKIYEYSFVRNVGIAFEYFDENGKYKKLTYTKERIKINKYASVISKLIGKDNVGSVVILKLVNSPEWCEMFYAILMAGYKPLLVNAKTSRDGVNNLIRQTKAVAVVTDDPFIYDADTLRVDIIQMEKVDRKFKPSWENEIIFCSSGTTGDVKLMVFDGENLCHQVAASLDMSKYTEDIMYPVCLGIIKILGMIPFHHIFGFVAVFLWYSFYGKTIVFPKSMNSKEIQELCQKRNITHIYSVPLFWDSLAKQYSRQVDLTPEPNKTVLKSLIQMNIEGTPKLNLIDVNTIKNMFLGNKIRMCISGGGYISEDTMKIINGMGYPLYNGFGMTEVGVSSVELSDDVHERIKCSIGKPFFGVEYAISHHENSGELLIKSKIIHKKEIVGGVLQDVTLDEDGYFHTGDIAMMDEDGNYHIKGRIKDVIINANGENIFPDELELYFHNIKNVINYTILGIRSKKDKHIEDVTIVLHIPHDLHGDRLIEIKQEIENRSKSLPNKVSIDKILFTTLPLPMANNIKVKRNVVKKAIEDKSKDYWANEVSEVNEEEKIYDAYTTENIVEPLKKMFSEVLLLPICKIKNNSHWINDLGGDSMNFYELITRVETKYEISIPDEKITSLSSIDSFVEYIRHYKK